MVKTILMLIVSGVIKMNIKNIESYKRDLLELFENNVYDFLQGCKILSEITECSIIPSLVLA
jgi:hypothetical protein